MKHGNIHQSILIALQRIEKKIDRIDTISNLDKEYLTTREACTYLNCSRTMLWKLVASEKLRKIKLESGRTYYSSSELKSIVESDSMKSSSHNPNM